MLLILRYLELFFKGLHPPKWPHPSLTACPEPPQAPWWSRIIWISGEGSEWSPSRILTQSLCLSLQLVNATQPLGMFLKCVSAKTGHATLTCSIYVCILDKKKIELAWLTYWSRLSNKLSKINFQWRHKVLFPLKTFWLYKTDRHFKG